MPFRVCIDEDICTCDGLCIDHCGDFVLSEDGISYAVDHERDTAAVEAFPGGCISIETTR